MEFKIDIRQLKEINVSQTFGTQKLFLVLVYLNTIKADKLSDLALVRWTEK